MIKLKCQDCGRTVEVLDNYDTSATCNKCGGSFAELGSEDDTYEEDADESDEYECYECKETSEDKNEFVFFDSGILCKDCIDKNYPRKTEVKEIPKFIEKEVKIFVDKEGTPINTTFSADNKTRFD